MPPCAAGIQPTGTIELHMLFTSTEYFILLGITVVFFYLKTSVRWQLGIALIASMVFYGWSQPRLLLLLLVLATITSCSSFAIAFAPAVSQKRLSALLGFAVNIGVLFFFKYAGWFSSALFTDRSPAEFLLSLPLPLGISFYTFRSISLLIDTYRRDFDAEGLFDPTRSGFFSFYARTVFFIVFFPQLIAGPIVKAKDFMQQIQPKHFRDIPWQRVMRLLIVGYFLKCFCANNLQGLTVILKNPWLNLLGAADRWTLLTGFYCQIFADFAGYSLIAIGSSALLGYRVSANFNFPFFADSFSDFWRRWHISLGSWLLDYIFTPLQIRWRAWGKWGTAAALLIAFTCVGIWHGAAWGFVVFGFLQAFFITVSVFYKPYRKKINRALGIGKAGLKAGWLGRAARAANIGVVFICVLLCFVFIAFPGLKISLPFLKALFNPTKGIIDYNFTVGVPIFYFALPTVLYHVLSLRKHPLAPWMEDGLLAAMLYMTVVNGGPAEAFFYFQF